MLLLLTTKPCMCRMNGVCQLLLREYLLRLLLLPAWHSI